MHYLTRFIALAAAVFVLAGCQTAEQAQQSAVDRAQALVGRTMGRFIRDSGALPLDAFPVHGGKVFIVASGACRLWLDASPIGTGSTADDWRITAVRVLSAPC